MAFFISTWVSFFLFSRVKLSAIHSRLDHPNIVSLCGAGLTSKGVRFVVLERLDGGTLTQLLGYDTRIRDRRRRFWRKKQRSYTESLTHAKNIANALEYLHERAVPGSMCLHRDLKPDNIGERINFIPFGVRLHLFKVLILWPLKLFNFLPWEQVSLSMELWSLLILDWQQFLIMLLPKVMKYTRWVGKLGRYDIWLQK